MCRDQAAPSPRLGLNCSNRRRSVLALLATPNFKMSRPLYVFIHINATHTSHAPRTRLTDPGEPGSVHKSNCLTPICFMHPAPSVIFNTITTENPPTEPTDSRQHGLCVHDPDPALSSADSRVAGTGEQRVSAADQLALDEAFARSLQQGSVGRPRAGGRLNSPPPPSTPSPPVANRITEYEQASTPPVRRREGPGFEVIKKQRSPGDKRSPIQDLPNGALRRLRVEEGSC